MERGRKRERGKEKNILPSLVFGNVDVAAAPLTPPKTAT